MRKVHVKSVVPIYAAALAWVLWALLLPLYKWWHFLLAAAVSVLFNRLASLIWKGETVLMPEPEPEPEKTGNPELDKFLADGSAAIAELTRLSSSIKKPDIKQGILRLIGISEKYFHMSKKILRSSPRSEDLQITIFPPQSNCLRCTTEWARRELRREYRRYDGPH